LKRVADSPRCPQKRARTEQNGQLAEEDVDLSIEPDVSDTGNVNPVRALLGEVEGFDKHVRRVLYQTPLSTMDNLATDIASMWDRLQHQYQECWRPRGAGFHGLRLWSLSWKTWTSLMTKATDFTYTVFRRGERDDSADPREAVAHLCGLESLIPIPSLVLDCPTFWRVGSTLRWK
jgi:hypothetical protein